MIAVGIRRAIKENASFFFRLRSLVCLVTLIDSVLFSPKSISSLRRTICETYSSYGWAHNRDGPKPFARHYWLSGLKQACGCSFDPGTISCNAPGTTGI